MNASPGASCTSSIESAVRLHAPANSPNAATGCWPTAMTVVTRASASAEGHGVGEGLVVTFRVDEAEGVLRFRESLEKPGSKSRLAAARGSDEQHVLPVGRQVHLCATLSRPQQHVMAFELRLVC